MCVTDPKAEREAGQLQSPENTCSACPALPYPPASPQIQDTAQAGTSTLPTCHQVTVVLPRELTTFPPFVIANSILCNLS